MRSDVIRAVPFVVASAATATAAAAATESLMAAAPLGLGFFMSWPPPFASASAAPKPPPQFKNCLFLSFPSSPPPKLHRNSSAFATTANSNDSTSTSTTRRRGRKKKQSSPVTPTPTPTQDDHHEQQQQQQQAATEEALLQQEQQQLPNDPYSDSDTFHPNLDFSFLDLCDEPQTQHDFTWPPLIVCFGPAKASFIPYARPSKRIFNHQIHQAMTDIYWSPNHFFRAPGSAASSVAIALARLDAQVDFIGKLGTDPLGNHMCSQFKAYGVQTQCTKIDHSASTAISYMNLTADAGRLTAKCVASSVEDALFNSDINWDVLKEAKMLYFNSSALLDSKSKSTLMEVIRIMKSQGSLIFFDVNLPLPLWNSSEEAKSFLKEAFTVSNFIEMTQHELDFLCEIEQNLTDNREEAKFVHRSRKRLEEFWQDDLKVVFITNGTSGVSYYTKESDRYFVGTEDVQIEPSSCDMSASGDALVAALMKMLVSKPDKVTDPSYLEPTIWYAIESGMVAQTLATLESGFYSD